VTEFQAEQLIIFQPEIFSADHSPALISGRFVFEVLFLGKCFYVAAFFGNAR